MFFKFAKNGPQKIIFPYIYNKILLSPFTTSTTTVKNTTPMVNYLIKTLGLTEKEAIDASKKLSPLKSTQKPDSAIHFLTTIGFNKTHIKKLMFNVPKILTVNIDKTLRPKLKAFTDVGIVGSDLVEIVCQSDVLRRSLDGHIRPTLEILRSVFGSDRDIYNSFVVRILKYSSWVLSHGARNNLPICYSLLESYGLSVEQIQTLFLRRIRYLLDPKWVQHVLIRVEEEINIPRKSKMFVHGVCALCVMSDQSLKSRFNLLSSLGFSDNDVLTMARKNPATLTLAESTIRRKVNILINEFGCKPAWIATRPSVLAYSMEKRIMLRHRILTVLMEMELIHPYYNLFSWLHIPDSKFIEKFLVPYKDKVPHLYDDFIRNMNVRGKVVS